MSSPTRSNSCAAIILAAGMSQRMGSPKALLDIDGSPLLCRLVETLHQVGLIDPILVVTGHEPASIRQALADRTVIYVHNPIYQSGGMLSSIKAGIRELPPDAGAFFILLLDQPLVQPGTLETMIERWRHARAKILAPQHQGRRGHPLLLGRECADGILSLPDDSNLRQFVDQHQQTMDVIEVNDPGILSDVDTPHDYQLLLRLWRTMTCPTGSTPS